MTHLTDYLKPITPMQGGTVSDRYELTYDHVDWESTESVGDETIVVKGRHVFDEVDASGFEAVKASVDASTEFADIYVTDDDVYVLKHALSDERTSGGVSERKMAHAVGTAMSELAIQGTIVGLRPVEEIPPTTVQLDEAHYFSDVIEATFVDGDPRDSSTDTVVYVLPASDDVTQERVLADLRTVSGIRYAIPDTVRFVDDESAIPEPNFT